MRCLLELYLHFTIVLQHTYICFANDSTRIHVVSHLQVNCTDVSLCITATSRTTISFPVNNKIFLSCTGVSKWVLLRQKNPHKKGLFSEFAYLVNGLAKLEDTNEECPESIIKILLFASDTIKKLKMARFTKSLLVFWFRYHYQNNGKRNKWL